MPTPSTKLRKQCEQAMQHWLAEAGRLTEKSQDWPLPDLRFDLRGLAAGVVVIKRRPLFQAAIRINEELLLKHPEETIEQTVPHEVAHYVAYMMYGKLNHGTEWRAIMAHFGKPPTRCHQMQATPARVHKKHRYLCGCTEHMVGSRIHARIQRGQRYQCKTCSGVLSKAA